MAMLKLLAWPSAASPLLIRENPSRKPPQNCFRPLPSPSSPSSPSSGSASSFIMVRATASASPVSSSLQSEVVVPAVIVGSGRIGSALQKMGDGRDIIVRRGEKVPSDLSSSCPIFVCTRNDVLDAVLESTPPERREDLVFFQNGMLEPWLESKGIADASQVLVYFAVAKLGDPPIDGKTDTNPEGLTVASGKWASAVAARLNSANLSCRVLSSKEFQKPLLEKLIWICAFMLVGARHPGATVGIVEKDYSDEVNALIKELAAAAAAAKGVTFDAGVEDRLCAYARSVSHFPTALKEFEWRNGWFYGLSQKALASGASDPCPLHTAWLKELGAV